MFHWRFYRRALIRGLPEAIRFRLFRSLLQVPREVPPHFQFRIARSEEELSQAFRLLHDCYVANGYMDPHPSGMRITMYHLLPSTSTLIAKDGDKVVATLSLIRDSVFGFPLEQAYDTTSYRKAGGRLVEVSALAIDPQYRNQKGLLLFCLLKYMYEYCIRYFGADVLLICVRREMMDLYRSLLFFDEIPGGRKGVVRYQFVNGVTAKAGTLDLHEAYLKFHAAYGHKKETKDLFSFFVRKKASSFEFPEREIRTISDPIMTPQLLRYFFIDRAPVLEGLSKKQLWTLQNIYKDQAFHSIFKDVGLVDYPGEPRRKHERFEVNCPAMGEIGKRKFRMTILEISRQGFKASLGERIRFKTPLRVRIALSEFDVFELKVTPAWSHHSLFGFRIVEAEAGWKTLVEKLEQNFRETGS